MPAGGGAGGRSAVKGAGVNINVKPGTDEYWNEFGNYLKAYMTYRATTPAQKKSAQDQVEATIKAAVAQGERSGYFGGKGAATRPKVLSAVASGNFPMTSPLNVDFPGLSNLKNQFYGAVTDKSYGRKLLSNLAKGAK